MNRIVLIQMLLCMSLMAMAQVKAGDIVQGKVTDEEGKPLMMANIIEVTKEKRIIAHAVSDVNGNYSLKIVDPKNTLMASLLQYKSVRKPISSHTINFVLELHRSDEQPKPKQKASSATSVLMRDDWETYVRKNKEYWGVSIAFPQSMIEREKQYTKLPSNSYFVFADAEESGGNIPIFEVGPIITLDDNCIVFMSSVWYASIKPDHEVPIDENTIPRHEASFTRELLNNCGLPWFHIDHEPSVLNNKELMEKINATKQKYIRMHANDRLTQITNSDRVFLTKIPYLDKIIMESDEDEMLPQLHLMTSATDCYGLEFYRADRYHAVEMLLFVNSKGGKTIDDYVEQISGYIKFDKNFKY